MTDLDQLHARWDERDRRYSMRKRMGMPLPVTEEERVAIKMWRYQEANELTNEDAAAVAIAEVYGWQPPMVVR